MFENIHCVPALYQKKLKELNDSMNRMQKLNDSLNMEQQLVDKLNWELNQLDTLNNMLQAEAGTVVGAAVGDEQPDVGDKQPDVGDEQAEAGTVSAAVGPVVGAAVGAKVAIPDNWEENHISSSSSSSSPRSNKTSNSSFSAAGAAGAGGDDDIEAGAPVGAAGAAGGAGGKIPYAKIVGDNANFLPVRRPKKNNLIVIIPPTPGNIIATFDSDIMINNMRPFKTEMYQIRDDIKKNNNNSYDKQKVLVSTDNPNIYIIGWNDGEFKYSMDVTQNFDWKFKAPPGRIDSIKRAVNSVYTDPKENFPLLIVDVKKNDDDTEDYMVYYFMRYY
jgi:hypothetical protein